VIVAVIAMRVMEMPVNQIINMVSMRYRRMSAVRAMDMIGCVTRALMFRRALARVHTGHLNLVFVDVTIVHVVQVPVVKVVNVALMPDRGMAAVRAVLVIMILVVRCIASGHGKSSTAG
jgi:hypothetical protein